MRILVALAILPLAACGKWAETERVSSPDKKLEAVAEHRSSAACCSDHGRVSLLNRHGRTLTESGVVVEAENARLKSQWEGNDRLLVAACGATWYEVRSQVIREEALRDDGSENAIRIDVVSSPGSTRNGKLVCP